MRLVNGNTNNEGRVEVMYDETRGWGTVCDSNWGTQEAVVVCRQLGFPFSTAQGIGNPDPSTSEPFFGQGSGSVWLNNIRCTGSELHLDDCMHDGWGSNGNCDHNNDAGIICNGMYYQFCIVIMLNIIGIVQEL